MVDLIVGYTTISLTLIEYIVEIASHNQFHFHEETKQIAINVALKRKPMGSALNR